MKTNINTTRFIILLMLISLVSVEMTAKAYDINFEIDEMTITELQNQMSNHAISSKRLTEIYLQKIKQHNGTLNAILEINPDALMIARQMDKERENGTIRSVLHGIPVVIKDNIDTADNMHTTAGSLALLSAPTPKQDAFVVQQLRQAGAVILAKANLSEWANFRSTGSSSGFSARGGQTRNPYILDRSPCGSSSGSAVAVSANLSALAIGTETDGSIICPSAVNGIVGIKPTIGLVSANGIIPIAHSQDTAGPMTRTVSDAAVLLQYMIGFDKNGTGNNPANQTNFDVDYTSSLKRGGLKGARIGVARQYFGRNSKVDALLNKSLDVMRQNGAILVDVTFPDLQKFGDAEYEVLLYEFKHGISQYLKNRGSKITNLKGLIEFNQTHRDKQLNYFDQDIFINAQAKGSLTDKAYLDALKKSKTLSQNSIDNIMDEFKLDAILAPSNAQSWMIDLIHGDNPKNFISSSSLAAVSGYPNITVPSGFIDKLPMGLSFFGRAYSEATLIKIAYDWEQISNKRKKPLFEPTFQ